MIYENIELSGSLDVSGSFIVPNGPSSSTPSNPDTGSLFFNTTDSTLYEWIGSWSIVGTQVTPVPNADIEYLVVAGGGGGGDSTNATTGGGGAGGLLSSSLASVESGSSFTITVGAGGATDNTGGDSSIAGSTISTITALGGGQGSGEYPDVELAGDGGSGGGGGNGAFAGGSGTVGQGNDGGDSASGGRGAGGGGAGAAGSDSPSTSGGNGGDGLQSNITGTSTYYAGGGGGASSSTLGVAGTGGQGGGGNGEYRNTGNATAGTANTGGGGGGAFVAGATAGGSGVVILAYDSGSINGAGGIVGDAGNGKKYHQFNTTGTFKAGATSDFGIVTDNLQVNLDAGNFASRGASTWTDLQGNYNATVSGPTLGNNFYYDFDGSNDSMTLSTSINLFNTSFTVEAWVDLDSDGTENTILEIYDTGTYPNHNTVVISAGWNNPYSARFLLRNYTSHQTDIQTSGTRTKNQWFHLVYTYDGTTAKIYEDGSLYDSAAFSGFTTNAVGSVSAVNIGVSSGDRYIDAQIGQLRIYYDALSSTEVLQNYNATKTNFV